MSRTDSLGLDTESLGILVVFVFWIRDYEGAGRFCFSATESQ
jgi:hypothetical protein